MKIIRFDANGEIEYGILSGQAIQSIKTSPFEGITKAEHSYGLSEVKLLAPCEPSKIVCLGLNYRKHAEETNAPVPKTPLIFLKPPTTVIGPEDNIVYPPSTTRLDYEGELAIVIKKEAKNVSEQAALDYVLGYTCLNDVTARDIQTSDGQWTRSKGFDTFCPIGPCIQTELEPRNTKLETFLNGELMQQTNTNDLIYPVRKQISFISEIMTLLPGDVIATGTPSGIGPMHPGDTVEVKIESIGTLMNHVIV